MSGGRPSTYDARYCNDVIRMGSEGYSVVEMCAEIGVHRNTLETEWPKAHAEFLEAFELAKIKSQAWWEQQGRKGTWEVQGEAKLNAGLYGRNMSARFPKDWRESTKIDTTVGNPDGSPLGVFSQITGRIQPAQAVDE